MTELLARGYITIAAVSDGYSLSLKMCIRDRNELFFNDGVYWISLQDGVKHYGNLNL